MNWKQTIGLLLALGLILAVCFAVIFPALLGREEPKAVPGAAKEETPATEEEKAVLPKLKGISWKGPGEMKKEETKEEKKKPAAIREEKKKEEKKSLEAEKQLAPIASKPEPEPVLELQEMAWYEQGGYAVVAGAVKNISRRSIPSVRVNAGFVDESGAPIISDHSMIELNPLFPGQTSPFSVTVRYYPEMAGVALDFTSFSGVDIPWKKADGFKEETEAAPEAEEGTEAEEEAPQP